MVDRQYELPVDLRHKSEVAQDRIGTMIIVVVMAITTFLLFLLSVNVGLIMARGASALPDVALLENWRPNESTRIFDRTGKLVANIHGDEDRVVVPLSEISPNIQRAVLAVEDNRFYQHQGVDIRGTFRAAASNFSGDDVQGGSTVTQQLVKNLFLSPERSMRRKIAEAILAVRVERHYDKNKILEFYLNQVYFGNQSYGIEKAARRYFRKPAKELTIAESALLAGLLKAPEGLSPYTRPEAARERQELVLHEMLENGYITRSQYEDAKEEKLTLNTRAVKSSVHPFFVTHVIQELEREFGSDVVRRGGLKVYTTMHPQVQEAAEEVLMANFNALPKYSNVDQVAMVVEDVETGEILAMVGGTDFEKNQFNNATQARRAAGSTFKPFVYLTGFRLGMLSPETMLVDKPISFNTGYSIWSPKNWDGKYMGAMTARKALTLSRNTTTVQVGMRLGISEVTKTCELAGIESPIDQNNSSLLGSSGMSPFEMTNAYATFARGGVRLEPTSIRKLLDSRGREVELERHDAKRVFEDAPVGNLVSILVDVVDKGTGRNARVPGRQVAGKTGTTDKVRDVWFMGFTPDMVAGVWMGNEKYVPLKGVFSFHAAKVWGEFAKKYYEIRNVPARDFPMPETILVKKSVIGGEAAAENAAVPLPPAAGNEPALGELDNGTGTPMATSASGDLKPLVPLTATPTQATPTGPMPSLPKPSSSDIKKEPTTP